MQIQKSRKYAQFLKEIHHHICQAQSDTLKLVNKKLILLYWYIGKRIIEKQEHEKWGDAIIENLADDLQKAFKGSKGFSTRNLWYMRDIYRSYSENEKLQTLSAEISWSHNIAILEKGKNNLEREFYMRMSHKNNWSYRDLLQHMNNRVYEKTLTNQTSFEKTLPKHIKKQTLLSVKDLYIFRYINNLKGKYTERQLEGALLSRIDEFLKEMGGVFTFVAQQYRLIVDGKEYFIDILLYHRNLKCLVAIELKNTEFIPEYIGKMQFYLAVLDATVKKAEEIPRLVLFCAKLKAKPSLNIH